MEANTQFDDDDLLGDIPSHVIVPLKDQPTVEEEAFAQAYIYHGKTGDAYREVFEVPPERELTEKERLKASMLYGRRKVQIRIKELRNMAAERALVSKSRILEEMAKVAFFDIRKLFDSKGNIIPVGQLDDETAAALNAMDVNFIKDKDGKLLPEGVAKFKMADKLKALDSLGKEFGVFREKVEITGKGGKDLIPVTEHSDIDTARRVAFLLTQGLREQGNG